MEINEVLEARNKVHGRYADNAVYAEDLKALVRATRGWHKLSPTQTYGVDMIFGKIARILAGDPNHKDHWDDIAGYAILVGKEIEMAYGRKDPPPPPEWGQPSAWRVKDFADGWIVFDNKELAVREALETGAILQELYAFTINPIMPQARRM